MSFLSQSFLILSSLFFLASCQGSKDYIKNRSDWSIVNGQKVSSNDLSSKSVVLISFTNDTGALEICTGVIVSEDYILTAAHCAKNQNSMTATFNEQEMPIVKIKSLKSADLALLKYTGGLPSAAMPAKLPGKSLFSSIKSSQLYLKLVGYGRSSGLNLDQAIDLSDIQLREKNIFVLNQFNQKNKIRIDQKQNDGGACSGDSGGPAFYKNFESGEVVVVAIASQIDFSRLAKQNNVTKDLCKDQSLYTNLLFYSDSIKKEIYSSIK